MANRLENEINYFLRSTENVTIALEAFILKGDLKFHKNKRILAVVIHRHESEGSLFILKPGNNPSWDSRWDVSRVFPIIPQFTISVAQSQRHPESPSEFTLTIQPGHHDLHPIILVTQDLTRLSSVLAECKRLKDVIESNPPTTPSTYSWITPYTQKHTPLSLLSRTPLDLRTQINPIHTRLSSSSAGISGDQVADIDIIRDDWVRRNALEEAKSGKEKPVDLRISVGTFNVNGKMPSQDLSTWIQSQVYPTSASTLDKTAEDEQKEKTCLPPLRRLSSLSLGLGWKKEGNESIIADTQSLQTTESDTTTSTLASTTTTSTTTDLDPDILALGFQELDLSTEALLYSTSTTREDAWTLAIFAGLGEKGEFYEKIASKQLVGMLLIVIAKKSIAGCFGGIGGTAAGIGIMGLMGNKGGTALRLTLTPTPTSLPITLAFVNAHLAAFDEFAEKRNSDYAELGKRLTFQTEFGHEGWGSDGGVVVGTGITESVWESDLLVWMVNLNYRVDLHDSDIRRLLSSGELSILMEYDQLKNAQRNRKAFEGFKEYPITHLPTYRFNNDILTDDMGYDIKRKPAWTDRVLHMANPSLQMQQIAYRGHPEITLSDHRPVSAEFLIQLDLVDSKKYDDAVHKYYHLVSDIEESHEPFKVTVENGAVDFGKISYKHPTSRSIVVGNPNKTPCIFHFVPEDVDGPIHPEWLSITPMTGVLLPHETVIITFTIYVDNSTASVLNLTSKNLEAILILHTVLGQDLFIVVSGEYQYTCFANSLSQLIRLPGPIRSIQSTDALLSVRAAINAPREVMRLVNWLMTNASGVEKLFLASADQSLVDTIRESLDTGTDLPDAPPGGDEQALAVAQTLLQFLDSLNESVIPPSLQARCAQMTSREEAFELLDELSSESVNVWISITAFLHFIAQHSSEGIINTSKAYKLATVFGPVLLRDETTSFPAISPTGKRSFLLHFIA